MRETIQTTRFTRRRCWGLGTTAFNGLVGNEAEGSLGRRTGHLYSPFLSRTSKLSAITLVSSFAQLVIAAAARTIYAPPRPLPLSSIALSIEHPRCQLLPLALNVSIVVGDFGSSVIDSSPVRGAGPNNHRLKLEDVARRRIEKEMRLSIHIT